MTHTHDTGAREAITTDTIIDDLRALDFGEVEDYYPEDEVDARRADWDDARDSWRLERADLIAAYRAGDRERAREILDTISRIEDEWGDDPQARQARRILHRWFVAGETITVPEAIVVIENWLADEDDERGVERLLSVRETHPELLVELARTMRAETDFNGDLMSGVLSVERLDAAEAAIVAEVAEDRDVPEAPMCSRH